MFCKIEFIPLLGIEPDEAEAQIWSFLCSLERNGQILKEYSLIKGEHYTAYVTLPHPDSFDRRYDGVYVRRERERLCEHFECILLPFGENLSSQPYCECETHTAIEMQTYDRDIDSVFTCCDCGRPIALYRLPIPAEKQEDYSIVQYWQENYAAMDLLWMNCLCDRYTGNQRVKHDSALNKQGRSIAQFMSEKLGCPVYYHLECDYGKSVQAEQVGDEQIHICPVCQTTMKRIRFSADYERDICEACGLSYDAH